MSLGSWGPGLAPGKSMYLQASCKLALCSAAICARIILSGDALQSASMILSCTSHPLGSALQHLAVRIPEPSHPPKKVSTSHGKMRIHETEGCCAPGVWPVWQRMIARLIALDRLHKPAALLPSQRPYQHCVLPCSRCDRCPLHKRRRPQVEGRQHLQRHSI